MPSHVAEGWDDLWIRFHRMMKEAQAGIQELADQLDRPGLTMNDLRAIETTQLATRSLEVRLEAIERAGGHSKDTDTPEAGQP